MTTRFCGFALLMGIARAQPGPAPDAGVHSPSAILMSPMPRAAVMTVAEILALERTSLPMPRAPVPKLPRPAPAEELVVITPDADGILDETRTAPAGNSDAIANPFRERYRPPLQMREVRVTIESIVIGRLPGENAAIISGRLYSPGDTLGGLRVAAVSAEAVDLRDNLLLLRLPVQDGPVTLRLPR